MINKEITNEKLDKYFDLTGRALEIVKREIVSGREEEAKEVIEMASNYFEDAKHFRERGDWVLSFGALNYAHGWIDSGVRLGIFRVDDRELFTIK